MLLVVSSSVRAKHPLALMSSSVIHPASFEAQVNDFWGCVAMHLEAWSGVSLAQGIPEVIERQFAYLSEKLSEVHPGLFLGLALHGERLTIVVTANGNPGLFRAAKVVTSLAPAHLRTRANVQALRPGEGFSRTIRLEGEILSPSSVLYRSLPNGDVLDLEIFVPGFVSRQDNKSERLAGAVFLLLDHALGEFFVATRLGRIAFSPLTALDRSAKPLRYLAEEVREV